MTLHSATSAAVLAEATENRRLLRDQARSFSSKTLRPGRLRTLAQSNLDFDRATWATMAELGWTGLWLPEDVGGFGLGIGEAAAILEELGEQLLPEPLVSSALLPSIVLARAPPSPLRDRLARGLAAGTLIPALAFQSGPDPFMPSSAIVSATRRNGAIHLSGRAVYVLPGQGADGYIVAAALGGKLGLYWVEAGTAGLAVASSKRPDGGTVADLTLEARVPESSVIVPSGQAHAILEEALDWALVATSAELLGLCRGALKLTLDYLKFRKQFGQTLGSFQALQHRVADMYLAQELCSAVLAHVTEEMHATPEPSAKVRSHAASRLKARATRSALHITREAIQLHGGIGFTDEHDIGLYLKRALVLSAWLGNADQNVRRTLQLSRDDLSMSGGVS